MSSFAWEEKKHFYYNDFAQSWPRFEIAVWGNSELCPVGHQVKPQKRHLASNFVHVMQVDNKSILFYTESKRLPKDTLLISVVSQKIKHHLLYFKYGLTIL